MATDPNEPKPRPDMPDLSKWGLGEPAQVGSKSKFTYKDIVMFMHCEFCIKEKPEDISPADFASFEVGMTKSRKLVIYCKRHKIVAGEFTLKNPPPIGPCMCGNPFCGEQPSFEAEPAFEMGEVVSTAGVDAWMEKNGGKERLLPYLYRHHHGDGGDLSDDDKMANFEAVMKGDARILSSYNIPELPGGKLWIITEADRSRTTLLLPSEY